MIRHIRFRLILNLFHGRSGKYFLYAIGEIVLITLGVLIALQINNWNKERTDRVLEELFLNRILQDLNNDIEVFTAEMEVGQQGLEAIKEALLMMEEIDSVEEAIEFNKLYDLTFMGFLSPQYATYQEMESTGKMNIIQNDALRSAILIHYAYYERIEEEFKHHNWYRKTVSRDMDANTSIFKYAGGVYELFPPGRLKESDLAFFKDPDHPYFHYTETALSAGGWTINYDLWRYSLLLERIEVLQEQIRNELENLKD